MVRQNCRQGLIKFEIDPAFDLRQKGKNEQLSAALVIRGIAHQQTINLFFKCQS